MMINFSPLSYRFQPALRYGHQEPAQNPPLNNSAPSNMVNDAEASKPPVDSLNGIITPADIRRLKSTPLAEIQIKDTQNRKFSDAEKRHMVERLTEVNELVSKYRGYKIVSDIYNSSIVEMSNGKVGKGTGAEGHVELTVCSEQGALADALRQTVSDSKMAESGERHATTIPKATRVFHGGDRLQPCANCMDWMHAGIFFNPESEIVGLHKKDGKFTIDIKRGKDFLPISLKEAASFSNKPLDYLPIVLSDNAKRVMGTDCKFTEMDLRRLISRAKQDYFRALYHFNLKPRTRLGVSAAVLLESGHVGRSPHIEMRRNTHSMPDITAFSKALTKNIEMHTKHQDSPKVSAIAYFGVDPEFPRPSNLNAFAHPNWGSPDVLIVSVHGDVIKIRTISDYLPYDFHKHKLKLSTRTNVEIPKP